MASMRDYENACIQKGQQIIAGCDEAGRGPIAGPLVVATCVLPNDFNDERINDSKKLTEKKRELLYDVIIEHALDYKIIIYDEKAVDELNVYQASKLGMEEGVRGLTLKADAVLSDAMPLNLEIPVEAIIKGDAKSITIAAASILAKVTRDRIMREYDALYPEYGFKNHKGYPTKKHKEAVLEYGVLPIHRRTFEPIKSIIHKQISLDL
ncbi:ribonuclease HII [Beduini massiliensis]|uniref:ribonuclease HII n=1 Tax=Beduini massiliensis TaxID=1585974 RepID=UPI000694AF11|nr:ribonuclease HII [Beduini massiliensis]